MERLDRYPGAWPATRRPFRRCLCPARCGTTGAREWWRQVVDMPYVTWRWEEQPGEQKVRLGRTPSGRMLFRFPCRSNDVDAPRKSTCQAPRQTLLEPFRSTCPAFPDNHYAPTGPAKRPVGAPIARLVLLEFLCPKGSSCRRRRGPLTPVAMPETPVNEHHSLQPRKNEIGTSWKLTNVQTIAISHAVNEPADDHLRRRVPLRNGRHDARADPSAHNVHRTDDAPKRRKTASLCIEQCSGGCYA